MKWNELKAMAESNPVGSTIYGLEDRAIHVPHEDFYNGSWHLGFLLVPTDDIGLMMIPYNDANPEEGHESLELELAEPVDVGYVNNAIDELRARADLIQELLERHASANE